MSTGLCRHAAYRIIVAQLEGGGDYSVDVCDEAATHRVRLGRAGDGLHVEVCVEVCTAHERELSETTAWISSNKLRRG